LRAELDVGQRNQLYSNACCMALWRLPSFVHRQRHAAEMGSLAEFMITVVPA